MNWFQNQGTHNFTPLFSLSFNGCLPPMSKKKMTWKLRTDRHNFVSITFQDWKPNTAEVQTVRGSRRVTEPSCHPSPSSPSWRCPPELICFIRSFQTIFFLFVFLQCFYIIFEYFIYHFVFDFVSMIYPILDWCSNRRICTHHLCTNGYPGPGIIRIAGDSFKLKVENLLMGTNDWIPWSRPRFHYFHRIFWKSLWHGIHQYYTKTIIGLTSRSQAPYRYNIIENLNVIKNQLQE